MLGTCGATTFAVNRDGKGPNVLLVLINTSYSRKKKSILINITSKWKSTLKQSSAECYDYIETIDVGLALSLLFLLLLLLLLLFAS